LGISNEITFSEASLDNENITNGYCAFNNTGVAAVVYIDKNNQTTKWIVSINGLSANAAYTLSVHLFGDLIVGFGPQSPLDIIIQQNADLNGILQFTTSINFTNLSSIIGRGLVLFNSSNTFVGGGVIGITNSSSIIPKSSSSSKQSNSKDSTSKDSNKKESSNNTSSSSNSSNPSNNTTVWIAIGVSAAVVALLIFGAIFYIKIKYSPEKDGYRRFNF